MTGLPLSCWLRSRAGARPRKRLCLATCFKGSMRLRRVAIWASPGELYYLLKLVRFKLECDLVDATLEEQQNSSYDRFGNTLGGPHCTESL